MEISKIEINQYKSIKNPITIKYHSGLPVVFIGKNGSGKTNILEALEAIALANGNRYGMPRKISLDYKVYIQLSEADITNLLPDLPYDKENAN